MTVNQLCESLGAACIAGEDGLKNEVYGCYIGDLLSWVMGRAAAGDAWITVMGNVNGVAVAVLADVACIILCESAHLDDDAKTRADENGVPVLTCERPAYALALEIGKLLGEA